MTIYRTRTLIFGITFVVACSGVWLGWKAFRDKPLYAEGHHQHDDSEEQHCHEHTHTGDGAHGHRHFGLVGVVTHSHPHDHGHHHDWETQYPAAKGFTVISHQHRDAGIDYYWAKAESNGRSIQLRLLKNRADKLVPANPDHPEFNAQLLGESRRQMDLKFKRSRGVYTTTVPQDFLLLPTHVVWIREIKLDGKVCSGKVPIDTLDSSPQK